MCQMSVILKNNDQQEKIMDGIAQLEITEDGVKINAMFEQPKLLPGVSLKHIDFIDRVVTLEQS